MKSHGIDTYVLANGHTKTEVCIHRFTPLVLSTQHEKICYTWGVGGGNLKEMILLFLSLCHTRKRFTQSSLQQGPSAPSASYREVWNIPLDSGGGEGEPRYPPLNIFKMKVQNGLVYDFWAKFFYFSKVFLCKNKNTIVKT